MKASKKETFKIDKSILGMAGEFAVAMELCRRNIYAQLTLGTQKRTDLLVMAPNNTMVRIEVKTKQGLTWPNCKGIYGQNVFLVFVDFYKKNANERPDFFILGLEDWKSYVHEGRKAYRKKHPDRRVKVDERNIMILLDEVNKQGKPYTGCSVKPITIDQHREAWEKITRFLSKAPKKQ